MKIKHALRLALGLVFLCILQVLPDAGNADESVILTIEVTGSDTPSNEIVSMSYDELEALPQVEFETSTNWTEGLQRFSGPSLSVLLDNFGIDSGQLELMAINDYSVFIPIEEISPEGPIIALKRNGEAMTIREKGPLWLVYNYDADPRNQTETVYSRSIWQLDRINISR